MALQYFECTKWIKIIHTHNRRFCICVNALIPFIIRLYLELCNLSLLEPSMIHARFCKSEESVMKY